MARRVIVKTPSKAEDHDDNEDDDDVEVVEQAETAAETVARIIAEAKESASVDIFDDLGLRAAEAGLFLAYEVYRDSVYLGRKTHPYSWDKLAAEYGGGNYRVDVRHPDTRQYIKRGSRTIAGEAKLPTGKTETAAPLPLPAPTGTPMGEMAALLGAILTPLMSVMARPKEDTGASFAQVLMQQQQAQNESNRMMFQSMQAFMEQSQRTAQQNLEFQTRILGTITDRMEKSLEKDKDKYTAADILKATQEAQENGFKMFAMLHERAEVIAEEKLAALPESSEEKGGVIDGILKTMAPMLMAGLAGQQGQAALPPAKAPQAKPSPRVTGSHEDIRFPRTRIPEKAPVAARSPGAPSVARPVQGATASPTRRGTVDGVPVVITPSGLPRVDIAAMRARAAQAGSNAGNENVTPAATGLTPEQSLARFQTHWYPQIASVLSPMVNAGETLTVSRIMAGLDTAEFKYGTFVTETPRDVIEDMARQIPGEAGDLLRGVYAACETKARNAATSPQGEAAGSEVEA